MIIKFTAEECRFAFDLIRHRPVQEMGKLSTELVAKVADNLLNEDEVLVEVTAVDLAKVYLLVNAEEGDVDSIRNAMKLSLSQQIQINLTEDPVMIDQEVVDPEFVSETEDPDEPVPTITIQVPTFSENWNEWFDLYNRVKAIQDQLDAKRESRILSGKQCLQSLR